MASAMCSKCGVDHSSPEALERLMQAWREESRQRDDIHTRILRGAGGGRRSSIRALLQMERATACLCEELLAPRRPTCWEILLREESLCSTT